MATGGVSFTFNTAKLDAKIRRRLAETCSAAMSVPPDTSMPVVLNRTESTVER